jgi:simple sugar transport system permease protein
MGIAVARTRILVFVLMGLCAALSGILLTTEMASWWPTQGEGYMLIVFASVFIGGTSVYGGAGTMYGTLVGAIIIGIIEAGILASGLSGFWTRMVHGCVILFAVSLFAWMQAGSRRL